MAYSTYRLLLPSVPDFFAGLTKSSWNKAYGPAKILFASAGSGVVQAGIRAQHTTLYSSSNDARWVWVWVWMWVRVRVCGCGCGCGRGRVVALHGVMFGHLTGTQ